MSSVKVNMGHTLTKRWWPNNCEHTNAKAANEKDNCLTQKLLYQIVCNGNLLIVT